MVNSGVINIHGFTTHGSTKIENKLQEAEMKAKIMTAGDFSLPCSENNAEIFAAVKTGGAFTVHIGGDEDGGN